MPSQNDPVDVRLSNDERARQRVDPREVERHDEQVFTAPGHEQRNPSITENTTGTSMMVGGEDASAAGDVVTEASQESFPASDPPGWTPQRV